MSEVSLYAAFNERYGDVDTSESQVFFSVSPKYGFMLRNIGVFNKGFVSLDDNQNQSPPVAQDPPVNDADVKVNINNSPRKMNTITIGLSDKNINSVGNEQEIAMLEELCKNVRDLDLSKNKFKEWNEIKTVLSVFKKLNFLNLGSNTLLNGEGEKQNETEESSLSIEAKPIEDYFSQHWPVSDESNMPALSVLILNGCQLDFKTLECLLSRLPNLNELHLARNNYKSITFSDQFQKPSLKSLYLNDNHIDQWQEVIKLEKHFPQLERLIVSDNLIENLHHESSATDVDQIFNNLTMLNLSKIKLNDWTSLETLTKFPQLKHLRLQSIPLLENLTDEQKFFMIVAYLPRSVEHLNGSLLTAKERDECERKFIRHYMEKADPKPTKYTELERKHGKLDKLAEVKMAKSMIVSVKIQFNGKNHYDKIDVRQTVGKFKQYLQKYTQCPAKSFRVHYFDHETGDAFGPDELTLPTMPLSRYNVKDGDEFIIDLKR